MLEDIDNYLLQKSTNQSINQTFNMNVLQHYQDINHNEQNILERIQFDLLYFKRRIFILIEISI